MVVGVASEAGIWRAPGGNSHYRQTWISGVHPPQATAPLHFTLTVTFDDDASTHTRTLSVAPGGRWAINLDDLRPLASIVMANAAVTITADQRMAATVALWHAPITRGVAPTVYPVPFVCVEQP